MLHRRLRARERDKKYSQAGLEGRVATGRGIRPDRKTVGADHVEVVGEHVVPLHEELVAIVDRADALGLQLLQDLRYVERLVRDAVAVVGAGAFVEIEDLRRRTR